MSVEEKANKAALALKAGHNEDDVEKKNQNYETAFRLYTEALKGTKAHVILCNRASVCMGLFRYHDALRDLEASIFVNASYAKAWNKKVEVLKKLDVGRLQVSTTLAEGIAICGTDIDDKLVMEYRESNPLFEVKSRIETQLDQPAKLVLDFDLVDPNEDLSKMKVAFVPCPQQLDPQSMQVTVPASLVAQLPRMLGDGGLPSVDAVITELKDAHKYLAKSKSKNYAKDSHESVQKDECNAIVNSLPLEVDEIKTSYNETVESIQKKNRIRPIEGGVEAAEKLVRNAVRVLPLFDNSLSFFLQEIKKRKGNPEIIVFEGHGHSSGLKIFHNEVLISGKAISNAIKASGLTPSVVMLGACHGFEVAKEAQKEYGDTCLFLGARSARLAREVSSGEFFPARFLNYYLRVNLGKEKEVVFVDSDWCYRPSEPVKVEELRTLWKMTIMDGLEKSEKDWFLDGALTEQENINTLKDSILSYKKQVNAKESIISNSNNDKNDN